MWVVDVVWANYARGRLVSFGQITRGMGDFVCVGCVEKYDGDG